MKKKLWWALAALAASGLLVWAFMPEPLQVETAVVTEGRFERAVQEDGKTRLRDRYTVSTPLAARVARIAVRAGDHVERDAALAKLWPVAPALLDERSRADQLAHADALDAALAKTRANRERAAAARDQARIELRRSEALAQAGFISTNQIETARLSLRQREQELESNRQEELAARHELERARIALRSYASSPAPGQPGPWTIRSPVTGQVLKVYQPSEGTVPVGTPLLELGDPSELEVVADLLTEDAAQIAPEAPVLLSGWGGPEALEGRVRLVEPAAFTKVSALGVEEQRVNVVIDILGAPEKRRALGDAFKVEVRILVQAVDQALKVPVSALFPAGSRSALFVVDGGRARQRELKVLSRNGIEAWVETDLKPGTPIIVYPPTLLKDGARVAPR